MLFDRHMSSNVNLIYVGHGEANVECVKGGVVPLLDQNNRLMVEMYERERHSCVIIFNRQTTNNLSASFNGKISATTTIAG